MKYESNKGTCCLVKRLCTSKYHYYSSHYTIINYLQINYSIIIFIEFIYKNSSKITVSNTILIPG